MFNKVAKSYDNFFSEKYYFPMFHEHRKYNIKSFFTYFKGCKFLGVTQKQAEQHASL
jgi:hypothetical protein